VLHEVTVEDYVEGHGENARAVKRVKFKPHDKLGALDKLGRHLGLFDAKHAEYLIDLNATQAAIRAGYSAKSARVVGCRSITKANIAAAIEKDRTKRAERTELTQDWVVEELRKIAAANMCDYMKSTPAGDPYLDFSALSRDQGAVLAEVPFKKDVKFKRQSEIRMLFVPKDHRDTKGAIDNRNS
jgi:hypothetical protein